MPRQALRFQEVEDPNLQDNRHMKVIGLSGQRIDRFYTPIPQVLLLVFISVRG